MSDSNNLKVFSNYMSHEISDPINLKSRDDDSRTYSIKISEKIEEKNKYE